MGPARHTARTRFQEFCMTVDVFVTRPGVTPEEHFGHVIRIPNVLDDEWMKANELGDGPLNLDALFGDLLAGIGRPSQLIPYGLVEPTGWERRFVEWVSEKLHTRPLPGWEIGLPNPNGPFAALAGALTDPLADVPKELKPARFIEAETPELEALAAARHIREWLADQDWSKAVDDVLVLLPTSSLRRNTWRRVFERHGLTVRSPSYASLRELPLGSFVMALADLATNWEGHLRRATLREVLLSPFYSRPDNVRRLDIRDCLRSLRRHQVTAEGWIIHVDQHFEAERQHAFELNVAETVRADKLHSLNLREEAMGKLAIQLDEFSQKAKANLCVALNQLLFSKKVTDRVHAAGDDLPMVALKRIGDLLKKIEGADAETLRAELESETVALDKRLQHGVELCTYRQFDDRLARFTVLGGLEEGGYPASPTSLSAQAERVTKLFGLPTPSEALSRQARVAAVAASKAQECLVLSWSRTDEAGSDTFPGPLLTPFLVGGVEIERMQAKDVVPRALSEVRSFADLMIETTDAVKDFLPEGPMRDRWLVASQSAMHSLEVDEGRAPRTPTHFGPYSGMVGVSVKQEPYSPTSLETLGQCATRYFLEKVLGAKEVSDGGLDLDPAELGTLLHNAMANAARTAIANSGAWDLSANSIEITRAVHEAVDEVAREQWANSPTLSRPLVEVVLGRWKRAISNWIKLENNSKVGGKLEAGKAPNLDEIGDERLGTLAESPDEHDTVETYRSARRTLGPALALFNRARAEAARSQIIAKEWYDSAAGSPEGLFGGIKGSYVKAAANKNTEARINSLDALQTKVQERMAEAEEKILELVRKSYERDRVGVPRRAVHVETELEVLAPHLPLSVHGRVDRVDVSARRSDAAIVDYKTGMQKSASKLVKQVGAGTHLQLPLYAMAVEHNLGLTVTVGRLAFMRTQAESAITLDPTMQRRFTDQDGEEYPLREVVKAHLSHSENRLTMGHLPLGPRACPLAASPSGYCDISKVCGYNERSSNLIDQNPQPHFAPIVAEGKLKKPKTFPELEYLPAAPVDEPPTAEQGQIAHDAGVKAARDASRNLLLSAGAGSGKTTALVDRYVACLESGANPENILCVTFTRKATAEMRVRVRERLVKRRDGSGDPQLLRSWILGLEGAHIHTIDALAGYVVQQLSPVDDPRIEVANGSNGVKAEYINERLADEAKNPSEALKRLLTELPLGKVREALLGLVGNVPSEPLTAQAILEGWEAEVDRVVPDFLTRVDALILQATPVLAEVDDKRKAALNESLKLIVEVRNLLGEPGEGTAKVKGRIAALWQMDGVKVPRHESPDFFVEYCQKIGTLKTELARTFPELCKGALEECDSAQAVDEQVGYESSLAAAAIEVAREWGAGFEEERKARRALTFGDVISQATDMVTKGVPHEVAARLPFSHILLDESQDTDEVQIRFIERLQSAIRKANGGTAKACTLFRVGDPKQSIYRFRGAEVDLFEQAWREAPKDTRSSLSICWRANPDLTVAIDRLFARLLSGKTPAGKSLDPRAAVPWQPLAPKGALAGKPCIELLIPDAPASPTANRDAESESEETVEAEWGVSEGCRQALQLTCPLRPIFRWEVPSEGILQVHQSPFRGPAGLS
jgi:hypothetical protein